MITTKAEQYLEVLFDIVEMLPDYEKENFDNAVRKKLTKAEVDEMGIGGRVGFLVNEMRAEIYDYEVKNSGNGKMLSLAKKVLKRSRHFINQTFHYAYKVGDYTYFSDTVVIIKTSQDLKSLEKPKELGENARDFDFAAAMNKCSCEKGQNLVLPNLCKLKTLYKLEKAKFKVENEWHSQGGEFRFFYDFGDNLPRVDGEKLIEIMDAIPDIEFYTGSGVNSKLYGKSKSREEEVALCPLRKVNNVKCKGIYTIEDVGNVAGK